MSQTGNEISFLLFRNFPQEEIHETEFHLTSFFCVPMKKKTAKKKGWKFYPCQTLPLPNRISLRGAGIYSMSKGNVLERSQHSSCQTVPLKYFIPDHSLLNATEKCRGLKWCYGFSIQCSLQELGLCLLSINHLMVTGGGPLVTLSAPGRLTPKGDSFPRASTQTKKGAASSHSWNYRGHTGLCQTSPFIL